MLSKTDRYDHMDTQRKVSRKHAILLMVSAGILAPVIYLCLLIRQPLWLFHEQDFRESNLVIKRVEGFRTSKGRLPESLEELGINGLSKQIFYQKAGDNDYEIWFSIALGESEVYESSTKSWR